MFKGSIVALVTPFKGEAVDEAAYRKLVEWQIKEGTSGIVPCGTTGESPTLSAQEHGRVVEICVQAVQKRAAVIAGAGSNSTAEAVAYARHAARVGADAVLVVTPYYNKPTNKGVYLHFKAVSEASRVPIILYNIAGRTGKNIEPEVMAKLAQDCKNIVGVKEASGSLEQMLRIKEICPKDFILLSGDDALTLPILAIGGTGVISVAANIVPKDVAAVIENFNKGDLKRAQEINLKLLPLIRALFIETNPIPVKKAMELMGLCNGALRLPMCDMEEGNLVKLKEALKTYGLIKG
ncbi:MAG: 4-hydroxy-tetrahydrodipicolinate synthase [Candidatus Omnitrophica bacterium]|nr:4-hydroxy-tetrahydrodipicolinate synthase [Candidatus Omnitrophota bacterium]